MHLRPIITRIIPFYVYLSILSLLCITSTIYSFMSFVCSREWKVFSHKKKCVLLCICYFILFLLLIFLFYLCIHLHLHFTRLIGTAWFLLYLYLVYVIKFHWIYFLTFLLNILLSYRIKIFSFPSFLLNSHSFCRIQPIF